MRNYCMGQRALWIVAMFAILLTTSAAQADNGGVQIELNKLQQSNNACRAFLVTQNLTKKQFKKLQLDIVMFNKKGIISKRLAVGLGPLHPNQTSVKVFDINKTQCNNLGQFLMNGVLSCSTTKGPVKHCDSLISVSARGSVSFIE